MDSTLASAPFWLLVATGLAGVLVGQFLPGVVMRYSPAAEGPTPERSAAEPPRSTTVPFRLLLAIVTATLFVLAALAFGWSWQLPAHLFLVAVAVVLTVIDLRHHLLPNAVVVPALAVGFFLLALAAGGENAWGALLRAVLGALTLFAFYLVLALISPAGLGMGDVKLAAVLGLFLGYQGWGALLVGALLASVVGAVVGLCVLVGRRGGLRSDVPFGPSMLAGALVAIVWGERLAREHLLPGLY